MVVGADKGMVFASPEGAARGVGSSLPFPFPLPKTHDGAAAAEAFLGGD